MSDSSRRRASARDPRRKDKVLHARIPDQLDRELRRRAGRLGLSVSTVVRHALIHTFDLVEGIVSDSARIAWALREPDPPEDAAPAEREPRPPEAPARTAVLGWQEAVLNVNAVCERCNAVLPKGTRGAIGVPAPARPAFLCRDCLSTLEASPSPEPRAAEERDRPRRSPARAAPRGRR